MSEVSFSVAHIVWLALIAVGDLVIRARHSARKSRILRRWSENNWHDVQRARGDSGASYKANAPKMPSEAPVMTLLSCVTTVMCQKSERTNEQIRVYLAGSSRAVKRNATLYQAQPARAGILQLDEICAKFRAEAIETIRGELRDAKLLFCFVLSFINR